MKTLLLTVLAVLVFTTAAATEFKMRPGRWEVTVELKMPQPIAAGMPLSEPIRVISCPSEPAVVDKVLIDSMNDDSCKVSNYHEGGNVLQFIVTCEGTPIVYRLTRHSADFFSAIGVSRSNDPNERFSFNYSARRTGAACSAKELAEHMADDE